MFKQRLGTTLLALGLIAAIAIGTYFLTLAMPSILTHTFSDTTQEVLGWIFLIALGVLFVFFVIAFVKAIWLFIQWIAIEPYQAHKKKKAGM